MKNTRLLFMILALALMCVALSACDFLGSILPGGSTTTTTATPPTTTTAPPPPSSVTTTVPAPSLKTAELEFDDATFTYDGQAKSIAVEGLPEGATVLYYIDGSTTSVETVALTNAGTYTVKAVVALPEDYEPCEDLEATVTITKGTLTVNVALEDATVIENGAAQAITYTGTLPEGVSATYVYRKGGKTVAPADVVAPGEYTVMLVFTLSDDLKANYNVPAGLSAKLTIEAKKDYDLSGVTLNGATTITYDDETPTFTLGNLPAGLTQGAVTINGAAVPAEKLNAGTYKVSIAYVNGDATYNDPAVTYDFDLVVDPAEVPGWSAVKFNGFQSKKTGDTFTIAVEGLDALTVTVTVEYWVNGAKVDAVSYAETGVYEATAKFFVADPNYKAPADMTATLTITEKEVYDLSGVTLSGDKTIVYGTATPDFELNGLPARLTQGAVTINGEAVPAGKLNAGTYKVVIALVNGNSDYMDPDAYAFDLVVNPADIPGWSNVKFESATKPNTGAPYTIAVEGLDGLTVDVTVEYYVNGVKVDAATYTATGEYTVVAKFIVADANYKAPADMTATLTIVDKKPYDFSGVTVNGATEIAYGTTTPDFELNNVPAGLDVLGYTITDKAGATATGTLNAGAYTVTFTFKNNDESYIDPDAYTVTLTVKAVAGTLPAEIEIVWDYEDQKAEDGDFIEYVAGKTYTVKLTEATVAALNAAGIAVGEYTGNTASTEGGHTATVTLVSLDGNTVYPAETLTWKLGNSWADVGGGEI